MIRAMEEQLRHFHDHGTAATSGAAAFWVMIA